MISWDWVEYHGDVLNFWWFRETYQVGCSPRRGSQLVWDKSGYPGDYVRNENDLYCNMTTKTKHFF